MNEIISLVEQYNPWWQSGTIPEKYKNEKKRPSYLRIFLAADTWFRDHKVLLMEGPRQVGKTHILHHLAERYLEVGVPRNRIIYINLQDPRILNAGSLNDLIQTCLAHVESQGGFSKHPAWKALFLLDEVQYADKWSDWLKILADRHDFSAKIIATGSALRLSRGTRESGVGRWKVIDVPHLSFFEYIDLIKPVTSDSLGFPELPEDWDWKTPQEHTLQAIRSALPFAKLSPLLNEYLAKGGYPDPAKMEDVSDAQEALRTGILSLVLQDPVDLKIVRGKLELQRLFYYLSTHTAEILSKDTIGKESGLNRLTLNDYLQCLKDIHLIENAPLFKNDGTQALKSHDKTYVATPCMASALQPREALGSRRGLILESAVAMHVLQDLKGKNGFLSYWRDKPDGQEVDIVAHWDEEIVPIEVKTQGKKSGMIKFLENYRSETETAYLLKDQDEWNWSPQKGKAGVIMPIAHFLYMLGWKDNSNLTKELEGKQSTFFAEEPMEIFLPESMTELKTFQTKIEQKFREVAKDEPYFRLVAGPEKLAGKMWNPDQSIEPFIELMRWPPRIRAGLVGDWYPGVENMTTPKPFSEGIAAEVFFGEGVKKDRYKSLYFYFNHIIEFFVPMDFGFLLDKKQAKWINPFPLVEYTVNFFRLFKQVIKDLKAPPPYWFKLEIINAKGFELHPGHPESMAHKMPQRFSGYVFDEKPIELSGRIAQLNPFKPDVEAFQVLKNLYFQLGLGDGLPFFDKDGTCRIQ